MAVATPPAGVSNGELIRWAFGVINEHDVAPLRAVWSDAVVERFPDQTCRGQDEVAGYFADLFAALPDVHMDVTTIVEQGEDVFVHWHLTGTHTGAPLQGVLPTGCALAVDGMDHFVVRDRRSSRTSSSSTRCSSRTRSACCRPTVRPATAP